MVVATTFSLAFPIFQYIMRYMGISGKKKGGSAMAETSTLIVREFPRTLRQQIHARAALEGKMIHEVIVTLLEQALSREEMKAGKRGKA
jgi:hypothetical protein